MTNYTMKIFPEFLQVIMTTVVDNKQCKKNSWKEIEKYHICAGFAVKNKGQCRVIHQIFFVFVFIVARMCCKGGVLGDD